LLCRYQSLLQETECRERISLGAVLDHVCVT
jgi:hypothetical protein